MDNNYELYRWDDPLMPNLDWSHLWDDTPFCTSCGETKKLTEVGAIPDSTYYLCPRCLAEERQE